MADSHPEALTFYYFLGMLPCGALPEHLLQMWGPTYDKCMSVLDQFGMLERRTDTNKRVTLTPFMMTYADETISPVDKQRFNTIIA